LPRGGKDPARGPPKKAETQEPDVPEKRRRRKKRWGLRGSLGKGKMGGGLWSHYGGSAYQSGSPSPGKRKRKDALQKGGLEAAIELRDKRLGKKTWIRGGGKKKAFPKKKGPTPSYAM